MKKLKKTSAVLITAAILTLSHGFSALADTWQEDEKGWRIVNDAGVYLTDQWYMSPESGLYYYMGSDGYMLTNTMTPDGYQVNADGVWVQQPEKNGDTWFDKSGLSITPQGRQDITLGGLYSDGFMLWGDPYTQNVTVTVTEITEGMPEGYKKVRAGITLYDAQLTRGFNLHRAGFDRYTGASFYLMPEHKQTLQIGDKSYDVQMLFESLRMEDSRTYYVSLICPVEYDGAVFSFAYNSSELEEQEEKIDSTQPHTYDELPHYKESRMRYYTLSNQ